MIRGDINKYKNTISIQIDPDCKVLKTIGEFY